MSIPRRRPTLVAALGAALVLVTTAACSGGSSDVVGAPAATRGPSGRRIRRHHQPVRVRRPQARLRQADPRLHRDAGRAGRRPSSSPTAPRATSPARSRPAPTADVVNFSVEPDVTRLVDAGLVDAGWNSGAAQGNPVRLGRDHRGPQGQPEGHQGLGRPAQAGRQRRHAEPVQLRLGEVEPAGAVLGQEQRRQERAGRPGLRHRAGQGPRHDPAEVRPRGQRHLPPGHRRRADQLRERGDLPRARRRPRRARHPADDVQDREPGWRWSRPAPTSRRPRRSTTTSTRPRPRPCWRRPGSVRSTRRVAKEYASSFPAPAKLWTIDDLGGWKTVDKALFAKDTGTIAVIYDASTK